MGKEVLATEKEIEMKMKEELKNHMSLFLRVEEMKEMVRLELERERDMREELFQMQLRNQKEKDKEMESLKETRFLDGMASTMNTIDGKLGKLEKMFDDVNTLSGHVGVMNDEVQRVKQPKVPVSRKKRANLNLTTDQPQETSCKSREQETTSSTHGDKRNKLSEILIEVDAIESKINDLDSMHSEAQVLIGQAGILEKQIEHLSKNKTSSFGKGDSSGQTLVIPDPMVPSKKRMKSKENANSQPQKVIDRIQGCCPTASQDIASTPVHEQMFSPVTEHVSSVTSSDYLQP